MEYDRSLRRRMRLPDVASFQFGIEEEYFLCDGATLQPAMSTPDDLFDSSSPGLGVRLNREMLQAQLEVASRPHTDCRDARHELGKLRRAAAKAAADRGFAILAAGTHPTADWRQAVHSPKERYRELMDRLQMVGRRNMLCGMHVHVEVPDPDKRVDLMRRMIPYVPLLLALSTSSPFWRSQCSGLKSYRLTAYDELPRTGLPELFQTMEDYNAYVSALACSGAIPNATHIWWAMRPSDKYPTLELRATDCCTRLDDAIAIAALYRCLVRYLWRSPGVNAELSAVDRAIAIENKWQAQRYGVEGSFVSPAGAMLVPDVLGGLIDQISPDAEALACMDEILHCRSIAVGGTSADAQLAAFQDCETEARGVQAALRWIAEASLA
jgi:carboxylate-amine ligase